MNIKNKIIDWSKIITRDNIFMYSAQASFYIIISSIPFVMMLISLAQFILPISESDVLIMMNPFIPEPVSGSFESIIHEVFFKVSSPVISITALSSFWTASRGIQAIERGTRNVYHTPRRVKAYDDILASFLYTVLFILIMLFFLTVFVFGNSIITFLELKSGVIHWIFSKTSWLKNLFAFVILTILFSFIYMAFSGKKIHPKNHLRGSIFTTFVWILFSLLYSFYIENFANYSYIYGSLTAIVLMMLWVYFCMIIFLIGGEINKKYIDSRIKHKQEMYHKLKHKHK